MIQTCTMQEKEWAGEFGKEYTDRNLATIEQVEKEYIGDYGFSRTELNNKMLKAKGVNLSFDAPILEVGCNVGNQLAVLQKMGYKNLWGIEIGEYALDKARERLKGVNLVRASAYDIPFKSNYFDLVFTSRVLIHLNPNESHKAVDEIYRCSKRYIWGLEYYADKYTEIKKYHGHNDILWKANFDELFTKKYADLKVVKKEMYKYVSDDNIDINYILEK